MCILKPRIMYQSSSQTKISFYLNKKLYIYKSWTKHVNATFTIACLIIIKYINDAQKINKK